MEDISAQVPFEIVATDPFLHLRTRHARVTLESVRPLIEKAALAGSAYPAARRRILYESVDPDLRLSTVDWYELANLVAEKMPGWRIAMVVAREYQNTDTSFYEATTQNLGTDLRYFDDMGEAVVWLTREETA